LQRNIQPKQQASQVAPPPVSRWNNHADRGFRALSGSALGRPLRALKEAAMNSIIYLVGLLVVVMAILSLLGLR
jgi:hypothetical protein